MLGFLISTRILFIVQLSVIFLPLTSAFIKNAVLICPFLLPLTNSKTLSSQNDLKLSKNTSSDLPTSNKSDPSTSTNLNSSFANYCPHLCQCSSMLRPSILPSFWDIPPRRMYRHSDPDQISLSASCIGQGLRVIPSPPVGRHDRHVLVELDLSDNVLNSVPGDAFSNFTNLRVLKLCRNDVHSISTRAFNGLRHLKVLELDGNSLESLPFGLMLPGTLEEVTAEDNRLSRVPPSFTAVMSLRTLKLAGNQLTSLLEDDLSSLPNLQTLSLARNHISSVHPKAFAALPALENLDLRSNLLTSVPHALLLCPSITKVLLSNNMITSLPAGVLADLKHLQVISLHGNPISTVHPEVFRGLPLLTSIILQEIDRMDKFPSVRGCTSLTTLRIDRSVLVETPSTLCEDVPTLRSLNLHHNRLRAAPVLTKCTDLRLLDLSHNQIIELQDGALSSQGRLQDLLLQHNNIRVLGRGAFTGLNSLQILNLEHNQISIIHQEAFVPLVRLEDINLGNNEVSEFPERGLEHIRIIKVHHNRHLKVFPGPERFKQAHTLYLSYAYHCCAFLGFGDEDQTAPEEPEPKIIEDVIYNVEDIQGLDPSLLLNMSNIWPELDMTPALDEDPPFARSSEAAHSNMIRSGALTAPSARGVSVPVQCVPSPGPFMPCKDLFDWWTLRCGVWIVFLLALLGNGTVVVVLCFARSKLDVPRFLVANLALADFFMGIYLGFLAVIDASTLGEFRMYAIPWQMSSGCQIAGFIGVLSSELSVFTLTVITLERNYAITHAMHLNKRLSLRHAVYVMFGGWIFAATMAILPIAGISDYRKFAVCLPFETDGAGLGYVVFLMFINGVCFLILMICYMKIYCSIRGSQAWNSNDSRIAKRMALLVFTDFACLAPIAFFSLTAAFGLHLITLEEAKVFTVFVLPFNSCCNPFLYALLTKQFKKDCVILCKTIEESRVTRGIGRCRHSSNFSNRQTPANTNSALEQSSRGNPEECNCQNKKKDRTLKERIRISLLKFLYCHRRQRRSRNTNNEYTYDTGKLGNNMRNTSMSSDTYSSSCSDSNWKKGKMPLSLRLLERRRNGSWYLARKSSQESNLSSSRNDSSATTASTSTWRISRSSVSSDISSGTSRVLGKNDSQLSLRLGSFRERRADSRGGQSPTIMQMQHNPGSFKRGKPKLQRQTAVEKETYLSNKFTSELPHQPCKSHNGDNLSCVYEQDSFEEDDMTQVTAFLTPTYRIAGLAVGFIPRKLSTISSHSLSGNKETDSSPGETSTPDQMFPSCENADNTEDESVFEEQECKCEGVSQGKKPPAVSSKPSASPSTNPCRYSRCPSDSYICGGMTARQDFIRRVATMPIIIAPGGTIEIEPPKPNRPETMYIETVPEKLLETHFPVEEPPDEEDPLL